MAGRPATLPNETTAGSPLRQAADQRQQGATRDRKSPLGTRWHSPWQIRTPHVLMFRMSSTVLRREPQWRGRELPLGPETPSFEIFASVQVALPLPRARQSRAPAGGEIGPRRRRSRAPNPRRAKRAPARRTSASRGGPKSPACARLRPSPNRRQRKARHRAAAAHRDPRPTARPSVGQRRSSASCATSSVAVSVAAAPCTWAASFTTRSRRCRQRAGEWRGRPALRFVARHGVAAPCSRGRCARGAG